MRLRAVASVVVVVALGSLGLSACGDSGTGSSSGTTTSQQGIPASLSGPSVKASLPVVTCQTTFGVTTTTTSLPSTLSVRVPAGPTGNLAVYSDPAGIMMLLGPKNGWTCHGLYGADGSGGLLVSPVGESVPTNPDGGWHVGSSSSVQAIVGYETGASPVAAAELACPISTDAAAALQRNVGKECPARPAAETVIRSSSQQVAFYDPAGTAGQGMPSGGGNPANGVVLYEPAGQKASAYLATCTLPQSQGATCSAVLQHFIALYG